MLIWFVSVLVGLHGKEEFYSFEKEGISNIRKVLKEDTNQPFHYSVTLVQQTVTSKT